MDSVAPKVRFCVNNPRSLDERNALIASGYECIGCLGNCTRCFETRFLEVDNRFVEGESYLQILPLTRPIERDPDQ